MLPPISLLEGLREHPCCEDLQAIYADWLEDQESPQAHLVRLGLTKRRLERSAPPFTDPTHAEYLLRRQALDNQMREYCVRNQASWLGPFAALGTEWRYEGGVLAHAGLPLDAFRAHGTDLLRLHPIGSLRLGDVAGKMQRLHPLEALRDLRRLSLRAQKLGLDGMQELAQCPQLQRLLALDLYHNPLDLPALQVLASSPNFPCLQELNLAYCPINDDGARALADAPCWPDLWSLDLRGSAVGLPGLLALARSPRRHALRALAVRVPNLDADRAEVREVHARFGILTE
jgi:uncharacterized protein (TIGR02996 family)